jgi:hypothetical protein
MAKRAATASRRLHTSAISRTASGDIAPVIAQKTGLRVEIDEVARDAYRSKVSTTLLSKAPAWDVVWLPGQ